MSVDATPQHIGTPSPQETLSESERIHVLTEEYRALYGLLSFRLAAVDRRLPVAAGTLGAVLGGFTALPADSKLVVLLAMPPALIWLLRTTTSHSRSKEDVLRRIDEIERQVNQIAGEELLAFQSRHPNRGKVVAGRSGSGIVFAVLAFCLTALASCAFLAGPLAGLSAQLLTAYWVFLLATGADIARSVLRLRRYRYHKPPSDACPLFVGRR